MNKLSNISLVDTSINPYERAHTLLKSKELYDTNLWNYAAKSNQQELDAYVAALASDNLPSLQSLNDKWAYSALPESNKIFALSVASNKNKMSDESTRKKRTYDIYDAEEKVADTKDLGELTDYEYYDTIFSLEAAAHKEYQRQVDFEQWKEDRGWLYNAIVNTSVVLTDFMVGVGETIAGFGETIFDIAATIGTGAYALVAGEDWEKQLREVWGKEQLIPTQQIVNEWNDSKRYFSTMVDVWGGQSFWSSLASGVATSIGNIVGAVITQNWVGGALSAMGATGKAVTTVSKVAHSISYYGTMFEKGVIGNVAKDVKNEHSIFEILAVNTATTAFEAASEWALGKAFGFSKTSALQFGTKETGMLIKNPFARFMINAVKEGSQEVIQEFGDWFITSLADGWDNKNGFYSDPMTFERIAQSFLAGFISESLISGFDAIVTHIKNDQWVSDFINKENPYDVTSETKAIFDARDNAKAELETARKDYAENKAISVSGGINAEGQEFNIDVLKGGVDNSGTTYDELWNNRINDLETKYNSALEKANTEQSRIDQRAENRRIEFETLDRKQKKEFKHGVLGLFNALQTLNEYTWKLGNDKRSQKLASWLREMMATGFQAISQLYGTMGQKAYTEFVQTIAKFEINDAVVIRNKEGSGITTGVEAFKYTVNNALSFANDLISKCKIDVKTANKAAKTMEHTAKLKDAAAKTSNEVKGTKKTETETIFGMIFDNDTKTFKDTTGKETQISDDPDVNQKATDTASELADKGFAICIKTENDINVFGDRNGIIIPIQNITDSVDAIFTSAGLNNNIFATSALLSPAIKQQIVDIFKAYNQSDIKYTFEDIMKILLGTNNTDLLRSVIWLSGNDTVQFFTTLAKELLANSSENANDNAKNEVTLATISTARQMANNLLPILIEYAQTMPIAESGITETLKEIDNGKYKNTINRYRYNFDLRNNMIEQGINGVPKNQQSRYKAIIETRLKNYQQLVQSMPTKEQLRAWLYSDKRNERKNGFAILDEFYDYIYNGPYNDFIYLAPNSSADMIFNNWLKKNNLTIRDINKKSVSEQNLLMMQFKKDCLGRYEFEMTMEADKPIKVIDLKPNTIAVKTHRGDKKIKEAQKLYKEKIDTNLLFYHTISSKPVDEVFNNILRVKDDINNAFLSVENIVESSEEYLSENFIKQIAQDYGVINRDTVYMALNSWLLDQFDTTGNLMGIVPNQNNNLVIVEYKNPDYFLTKDMQSKTKAQKDITKYKQRTYYDISEFIQKSKLIGDLANVKVRFAETAKKNSSPTHHFNPTENIITLDISALNDINSLRFAILHEFNHAIDFYNGLNQGMNFIDNPESIPLDVAENIKKHVDINTKMNAKELSYYLYYSTGSEFNAEGIGFAYTSYPAIRKANVYGYDKLLMAWGDTLEIPINKKQQFVKEGLSVGDNCSAKWKAYCDSIVKMQGVYVVDTSSLSIYDFNKLDIAFILPDGRLISGFDEYQNHIDIQRNWQEQLNFNENFLQSIISIRTNDRINSEFIDIQIDKQSIYCTIGGAEKGIDLNLTANAIGVLSILADFALYNNFDFISEFYYDGDEKFVSINSSTEIARNGNTLIAKFINKIRNEFDIAEQTQEHISDIDDDTMKSFTKTRRITDNVLKDAKKYVDSVNSAKLAKAKGESVTKKEFPVLSAETLKAIREENYIANNDPLFKRAEKIIDLREKHLTGEMRREQRKSRGETYNYGYVNAKKAKGTLAQFYIKAGQFANYRAKLSAGMLNFLYNLNENNLDKLNYELREMFSSENLKEGDLPYERNIKEFIRVHYNDMNDFTFNLIKESFFPNSPITSTKELSDIANAMFTLYGYNAALLEKGLGETNKDGIPSFDVVIPELKEGRIKDWFKKLEQIPGLKSFMEKKLNQWYPKEKESGVKKAGDQAAIDVGQIALSTLKYYDGTLSSITYIGAPAVQAMLHPEEYRSRTKKKGTSEVNLEGTIKGKREGTDKDTMYADVVAAIEDRLHLADRSEIQQRAIGIVAMQISDARRKLQNELIKAQKQFKGNQEKMMAFAKYYKERESKIQAYQEAMEEHIFQTSPKPSYNWTNEQIIKFIMDHQGIETRVEAQEDLDKMLSDFELLEKAYIPVKKTVEIARSDLRKYLNRQLNRTINDYTFNMFDSELRKFIKRPATDSQKYSINEEALREVKSAKDFDDIRRKFVEANRDIQAQLRALARGDLINKSQAETIVRETEKRTAKAVAEAKEKQISAEKKLGKAEQEVKDLQKELKEKGKEFEALSQAHSKAVLNANKTVSYETKIPKTEITIKSDTPIPPVLYKMFNVTFTKTAISQVQSLDLGEESLPEHTVISATEFFKQTANLWAEMTDGDAQRIIDFCEKMDFVGTLNFEDINKVKNLTDLVLYTLLEWDRNSQAGITYKDGKWYYIDLTDEQRAKITYLLKQGVSDAARRMERYGELLRKSEPWRTVANQLKYELGIEIDDDVWEEGQRLLAKGEFDKFQELSENEVRDKLIEKYQDDKSQHRVRWIANQMVQYMRAAMLSAPKTIIRNRISNYAITALRKITDPVGNQIANLALKAQNHFRVKKGLDTIEGYREGQVDLSKKIDWSEHQQLNDDIDYFFNSAVMALFHDNITKYDIFEETEQAKAVTKSYWQLRIDQLRRDIQNEMMFDPKWIGNKLLQKMSSKFGFAYSFKDANDKLGFIEFIMRMQSDDQFIDKRAKEIFKRLLIEEKMDGVVTELIQKAQAAEVDPYSMLMTDDIFVRLLAKAYGQAGYEYMHRPSFFGAVANYLNKNYPFLGIMYRLTLPFISGGFLWWQEANKYTPWHLVKSLTDFWRLDKFITKNTGIYEEWQAGKRTGERPKYAPEFTEYNIRSDLGKGLVGTCGIILAMVLGSLGFIIKDEDDDKYKFNFGLFTVDASQVFGMDMFSVGAAFAIATKNKEGVLGILEAALGSTFENFFMSDIINQMRYNNGIGDYFADKAFSIIGSFIPNVYKAMLRATNKYKIKYDQGLKGDLEYLIYQIVPFAWTFLPKKIDPYTGDLMIRNTDSWFVNIANELGLAGGLTIKTDMPSELERELSKIDASAGNLSGEYEDVGQLDKTKLNVIYGKLNDKALNDFINNKAAYEVEDEKTKKLVTRKYSQMTDTQKKNVISRIKSKNAKYAKVYVWTSEGHKYYTNDNERKELAKLGIIQNVYAKTDKLKDFVK